jgi:ribonuclease P protein component
MLSRQYRFHGRGSLKRVYGKSQNIRGPLISLRYSRRLADKPYRVAVVVGRKVNKSAVKRNRIRRRIYEVIRKLDNLPKSTDLILTVYSDQVIDLSAQELANQISSLIQKVSQKT